MRPLRPEERQRIIDEHPKAAPSEIEADLSEYDNLVSQMFQSDPDAVPAAAPEAPSSAGAAAIVSRLAQLHSKLFR